MLHLELRLLGTQLLELRMGRQDDERTDEWWRGSLDDDADDSEESEPHEWIGCQFPLFAFSEEADEDDEDDEDDDPENDPELDLDEEWATLESDDENR
jgi:hypothetical protein